MTTETWYKLSFDKGIGKITKVKVAKSNSYIVWVVDKNGDTKKFPKSGLKEFYYETEDRAIAKLQLLLEENNVGA